MVYYLQVLQFKGSNDLSDQIGSNIVIKSVSQWNIEIIYVINKTCIHIIEAYVYMSSFVLFK